MLKKKKKNAKKKKNIEKGTEKKHYQKKDVWLIEGSILRAK